LVLILVVAVVVGGGGGSRFIFFLIVNDRFNLNILSKVSTRLFVLYAAP